jgi:hypothetical protein
MKFLVFPFLGLFCAGCHADVDGCIPMQKAQEDAALPRIRAAFADSHRLPIDEVIISPGRDCGNEIYFGIEARPDVANFGSHWIVTMKKANGKIEIQDGI